MKISKGKLFQEIDNSPLIIFRMLFGFLLFVESWGAILTGWVKTNLISPKVFFSFIGFEWLHPLPGYGMYFYFICMGVLGLLVMIGYRYRLSLLCFTILWTAQYLMQKTAYNNHYYFLTLICFLMLFLPANAYYSIDVKRNKNIKSLTMPQWCSFVLILQVSILYIYASIAKLYPDWLDGTFTRLLYSHKTDFPFIGKFFTEKWFYISIAYLGILFDGLIVPMMLWKKTRTLALIASLIFHLSNSFILKVGIFPYFALSFIVFFYPPDTIRRIFFKKRPALSLKTYNYTNKNQTYILLVIIYFIIQLLLPIRHYFIKGDVFWTEEGHRLSWRMMLRQRNGSTYFTIIDKKTKEILTFNMHDLFTEKQIHRIDCYPDFIWQAAQYIKQDFKQKNKEIEIYANTKISVNAHPFKQFIDPKIDLASVSWDYFKHSNWILLYDDYRK
ncbi:MAG: HTTM domain-containing protein [Apibacter sp.]|uniref:HTTM domain-containing protein n=1 Tax=Apibacter sp. TaxID=2023709 RepID=UPI0025EFA378|nr:HTTM domain-containing protein [Apibacter sp.]MCT6869113.1 HTTM domain-containing protein [Apibacter sp.]